MWQKPKTFFFNQKLYIYSFCNVQYSSAGCFSNHCHSSHHFRRGQGPVIYWPPLHDHNVISQSPDPSVLLPCTYPLQWTLHCANIGAPGSHIIGAWWDFAQKYKCSDNFRKTYFFGECLFSPWNAWCDSFLTRPRRLNCQCNGLHFSPTRPSGPSWS